MKRPRNGCILISVLTIGVLLCSSAPAFAADEALQLGKKVFDSRCAICHGDKGNGKGDGGTLVWREKSGQLLNVQARDFTLAVFRFRSTPTGCLPTDTDVTNIIKNGIPKSFMSSHKNLSDDEVKALVEYIKTFSKRWNEEKDIPCEVFAPQKPEWVGSLASVEKGKEVYSNMKCWECHGEKGGGDGPKAEKLKDDSGKRIFPFDFTTADLKRGTTPENIYLTYTTGIDGSGMPSYEDSLKEDERWHLVSYTLKLMGR